MTHQLERWNAIRAEGRAALGHGDCEHALRCASAAAKMVGMSDPLRLATSFDLIGDVRQRRGEIDSARSSYADALALYRQLGSAVGIANVELSLGFLEERLGANEDARRHFENALQGYRAAGRYARPNWIWKRRARAGSRAGKARQRCSVRCTSEPGDLELPKVRIGLWTRLQQGALGSDIGF